ncbi:MAG: hypothetical protein H7201_10870 [Candidatus Saccharibacteria bacterium]|nr:hypothetical protein [Microbacteriaceae bacterium]
MAQVGAVLTAVGGAWLPATATLAYQWRNGGVAVIRLPTASVAVRSLRTGAPTITGTSPPELCARAPYPQGETPLTVP